MYLFDNEFCDKGSIQAKYCTVYYLQRLWLLAMCIIKEKDLPVVCRLGGFHTIISFLGSIRNLMKGSEGEDFFEVAYAVLSQRSLEKLYRV